jgi:dihydroxyacetone kinase
MSTQATLAKQCFAKMLLVIERAEDELARLDAFAGDGDHGAGMAAAGNAFTDTAGGASGVLFGTLIATVGENLSEDPDTASVHHAMEAGVKTVCDLGKTAVGDKTMIDTLAPFVEALGEASQQDSRIVDAWLQALPRAKSGMEATANMVSKRGRSSRLGARSVGGMDPGAVSTYYMLQAVADTLKS